MKKNKNTKVETETKVIEQSKVETVVETPKKKRKHYHKSKAKQEVAQDEILDNGLVETSEMNETQETKQKPTFKDWLKAIKFGLTEIKGFRNKVKWLIQLFKLNA